MRILFATLLFLSWQAAQALDLSDPAAAEIELKALANEWRTSDGDPSEKNQGLGSTLQALGIIQRQIGKPEEAVKHLQEACILLATTPLLTDAQEALALALQDLGQLEKAEKLLREVVKSRADEHDSPQLQAASLDHLALNLLYQGRYPEVSPLLGEAMALLPQSAVADRARLLGHQGRLLHTLGNHERARRAFQEALELDFDDPALRLSLRSQHALSSLRLGENEKAKHETEAVANDARQLFRESPLQAAPYLNNLGALALTLGNSSEAINAFQQVIELSLTVLAEDHPSLATPLQNLGVSLIHAGRYQEAEEQLLKALSLQQEIHAGEPHLRTAETLRNLAVNAILSDQEHASSWTSRATTHGLQLLEQLLQHGSEIERLNFLQRFDLVSLPCIGGDAEEIANVLLASKSRLLDALLRQQTEELTPPPDWKEVQEKLPAKSAFIDYARYFPAKADASPRYGAVVLLSQGPPRWVHLGSENDLQNWLRALRRRLAWQADTLNDSPSGPKPSLTLSSILKGVEQQFWKPLQLPEEVQDVIASPDASLHFLPFAALLDAEGTPLSHRLKQLTSTASGRSLLKTPGETFHLEQPWAVITLSEAPNSPLEPENELDQLMSELGEMPGTQKESRYLKKIAPNNSVFLSNEQATEARLRQLPSAPGVLHLGCHAFFIGQDQLNAYTPLDADRDAHLLESTGIILHQNREASADRDGLLFPNEIAQLPLEGTRLVTLSSCDSGLGTPVGGEGILGLRRAFTLAGAQETVVALWPVSDRSTPQFMDRFYRLIQTSGHPAQSLWQAQREALPPASDPEFERAVLRFAPFSLAQEGPLIPGEPISAASPNSFTRWIWLGAIILIVVLSRLTAQILLRKTRR